VIRTVSSLAMAAMLFIHPIASFAEFSVVTSADVAYKTGKFALPTLGDDVEPLKPVFKTLNVSLAAAYGNAYLAAAYESPFSDHQDLSFESRFQYDDRFTRSDANLTVGYRVWPWLNVFGGYLHGKSELQRVQYQSLVLDELFIFRYNETGPFAGVSLSHSFSKHGTLSFSVAYAKLDGKVTFIRNGYEFKFPTADTSGFSYSLLWIGSLDSTLSYRVGIKATRYEIDFSNFSTTIAPVKESYSSIFLGITKAF